MINWKTVGELHVIQKLKKVIESWYGVELFYTDQHGKIQTGLLEKSHEFRSHFMKVQMLMPHGHQYIAQDIETIIDYFDENPDKSSFKFSSFFPHVKGYAAKIVIDGELLGTVIAYPFVRDTCTTDEISELISHVKGLGVSDSDAEMAVDKLKKVSDTQLTYITELVSLVAEEVMTFHAEIQLREERISALNSELGSKYRYHNMIGKSKPMQQIYNLLTRIATSEATILIQGENGTGKELVAKAIHYHSPRKDSVFVAQNCSAFNDNLLDSELFGHVKGAFTGAVKDKKGLFEVANGGTLFLDEIGDTSLSMQVKLLRVLQEGTFLPVGSTSPKKVNVRVIAATNKNLKEMIAKGEFREDLYYRINVINVTLPSLRERKDDIPVLCDHFLEKKCADAGHPVKTISPRAMEKVLDYNWPGNVRELENEIERLVVLSGDSKTITPDILNPRILDYLDAKSGSPLSGPLAGIKATGTLREAMEELEYFMIKEGLRRCNFNKSKLAKELGISRAGLIQKVDKYELDKRALKKASGED